MTRFNIVGGGPVRFEDDNESVEDDYSEDSYP
jgi:hypothetical protein